MKGLKYNLYLKIFAIVVIGLLLMIPAMMVMGLINERKNTQMAAIDEVSSKWGYQQTLNGPYISIPYNKYLKETDKKTNVDKLVKVTEYIHILPSELKIDGNIKPEKRNRSIYEVVVYNTNINFSGKFPKFDPKEFDISPADIDFNKAILEMGITDLLGIERQIELNINEKKVPFNPGVISNDILSSGINSGINYNSEFNFSYNLDLRGSQVLNFTPVGKTTDVTMKSTWNNPSFSGAFLPDKRSIAASGFSANWNILHLNRNYPQSWTGSKYSTNESVFGIDLLLPVDNYQKATRAVKYAILFIGFTFLVFFFIEVLNKVFIHPVQYILVGTALVIFFALLLSISEYLNFDFAYIISAISTLVLIALYIKAILKNNSLTILISSILFILYSFIFIIIQLQDYALLIGSIGIFLILALVMYFSRKIDWYNLNLKEDEK